MSWLETKQLNEEYQRLAHESRAMLDAAEKEGRSLNTEEDAKFNELHTTMQTLQQRAENIRKQADVERLAIADTSPEAPKDEAKSELFRRWCVGDTLSREERSLVFPQRAVTLGTAGSGAEFVPEGFADKFFETLKYYGGMLDAGVEVLETEDARPIPYPYDNDTGLTGEVTAEVGTVNAATEPTTGDVTLNAYFYDSKQLEVSQEFLLSAFVNPEEWLAKKLGVRVARKVNTDMTNGAGSNAIRGFLQDAPLGVTAASASTVTIDELRSLQHAVNYAYRNERDASGPVCKYMMADATIKVIKTITDGDGRRLWGAGDIHTGAPQTLDGYPIIPNDDMPAIASAAKTMAFGAFNRYVQRVVRGGVQLHRDPFSKPNSVKFTAWLLTDGHLVDTTAIKHLVMATSS